MLRMDSLVKINPMHKPLHTEEPLANIEDKSLDPKSIELSVELEPRVPKVRQ